MDTGITKMFDTYSRRARLYPAFISAAPIVVSIALLWPASPAYSLVPVAISMGVLVFLSTWVRGRGQVIERRLMAQWGGFPTTHMLRHVENTDMPSFRRRRERLMALLDLRLPNPNEERADPVGADDLYVAATRALIARVRHHRDWFPLVQEENIQYGFRRNLYAMKPIALAVLTGSLAFDSWWLRFVHLSPAGLIAACIHGLSVLAWLFVVKPFWVWQQGLTYAQRLFESVEDDRLANGP